MKKILLIIIFLVTLTGCRDIRDLSYDEIVLNIQKNSLKDNVFRTGYSYYLPRGVRVSDTSLYNEVLEDHNNKYYLYVDIVSYYNKKGVSVETDNSYISYKFSNDGIDGYLRVDLKDDKYLVEIIYNYAKIEVMVEKGDINEAINNSIIILSTIKYDDDLIENLIGENKIKSKEENVDIFGSTKSNENFLKVIEEYDNYDDEKDENEIPDFDVIN